MPFCNFSSETQEIYKLEEDGTCSVSDISYISYVFCQYFLMSMIFTQNQIRQCKGWGEGRMQPGSPVGKICAVIKLIKSQQPLNPLKKIKGKSIGPDKKG